MGRSTVLNLPLQLVFPGHRHTSGDLVMLELMASAIVKNADAPNIKKIIEQVTIMTESCYHYSLSVAEQQSTHKNWKFSK